MKIEIKNWISGKVLFTLECASWRVALEMAVKQGACLQGADLKGADLKGADLQGAYLQGAKGFSPEHSTPLLMLLDQPGPIRAYKLVGANGEGIFNGGIKYEIGKSYEVKDALTDTNVPCGAGINLATLDWCLEKLKPGCRVLVAEFTAKDIAAIPTATDGKFRVYRCKIVGEKKLKKAWFPREAR